jgi:hypothetical protein
MDREPGRQASIAAPVSQFQASVALHLCVDCVPYAHPLPRSDFSDRSRFLGTMSVWWLIGILLGHGADGDIAVFFYGFFFVLLCGCGGLIASPPLTRGWWTHKSPLRF